MGDRAYLEVTCRQADISLFEREGSSRYSSLVSRQESRQWWTPKRPMATSPHSKP